MGFTRYYAWSCDIPECYKTEVGQYREGEIIPEGLPQGWCKTELSIRVTYMCPKCATKYGDEFLKKLYPPQIVTSDPGAKGGDYASGALINAHAVSPVAYKDWFRSLPLP